MNKKKLIAGVFLLIVGVGLIILGFMPQNEDRQAAVNAWNELKETPGVEGVVESTQTTSRSEGTRYNRHLETYYCPVYSFPVNDQKETVRAVGDDCKESRDDVVIGSTATIVYEDSNPDEAFVKSDATEAFYKDSNGGQWVAWVMGIFLALIGALGLYGARPKTPEQLAKEAEARQKLQAELDKLTAESEAKKK